MMTFDEREARQLKRKAEHLYFFARLCSEPDDKRRWDMERCRKFFRFRKLVLNMWNRVQAWAPFMAGFAWFRRVVCAVYKSLDMLAQIERDIEVAQRNGGTLSQFYGMEPGRQRLPAH